MNKSHNYQLSAISVFLLSTIGYQLLVVSASGQTLAPVHRLPLKEPLETSKKMPPVLFGK
jgi:hypothetical protein